MTFFVLTFFSSRFFRAEKAEEKVIRERIKRLNEDTKRNVEKNSNTENNYDKSLNLQSGVFLSSTPSRQDEK